MEVEDFRVLFGKNLKNFRKNKKLTQSELAEIIGIETHNLNRIENGKSFPQVKTLVNIFNYFNIEPYELFIDSNEKISLIADKLKKHPSRTDDIFDIVTAIVH